MNPNFAMSVYVLSVNIHTENFVHLGYDMRRGVIGATFRISVLPSSSVFMESSKDSLAKNSEFA